jgi:hypothetical protein
VLHEIRNVKQERGAGRRRWFESDGLDLVVWYDPAGTVTGFQLCYDLGSGEHALTWLEDSGFSHSVVDSGDYSPFKNKSPTLEAANDEPPWAEVGRLFDERSGSLESGLRQLVHDKLVERAEANAGH